MRSNQTLFDQTTPEGIWQTLLQLRSTCHQSYLEQFIHDEKGLQQLYGVRKIAYDERDSLTDADDATTQKKILDTCDVVNVAWNCAMTNKMRRDYPEGLANMKEDT